MKSGPMQENGRDSMDWEAIRHRLDETRQAIEALSEPGPALQQQILHERSLRLARAGEAAPDASAVPDLEVLSFKCAGERYAFESGYVARVCSVCPITPIPGTPDFVTGIISSSGEVLSVIDLRVLLNLPISRLADPSSIIILRNQAMEFGILAEEIVGAERYSPHALERRLPTLADTSETYLIGVAANRTAILNAEQLLCDPRLVVDT